MKNEEDDVVAERLPSVSDVDPAATSVILVSDKRQSLSDIFTIVFLHFSRVPF